nr:carbohydrate-binding protein [uncultured bacterium]
MSIRRIRLRFAEVDVERTQEFTIRWSGAEGGTPKEIVRQQWNFSPAGATSEVEDYEADLDRVSVLELSIKPDIRGGEARASLAEWRIA